MAHFHRMTRSADIPRMTSAGPVRSYTRVCDDDTLSLSVGDIYRSAENERLSYSCANRRQVLEHAQSQIHRLEEPFSRPATSASQYAALFRRGSMTPKSLQTEPAPSRASTAFGISDFDESDDHSHYAISGSASPVSRQCCDVFGGPMCRECRKSLARQIEKERSDFNLPGDSISDDNIAVTAIIKRYYPHLTLQDIQAKISKGEIARPRVPSSRSHSRCTDVELRQKPTRSESASARKSTGRLNLIRNTALFFTNIRELNDKIVTGKAEKELGFEIKKKKENKKNTFKVVATKLYPVFISPKKNTSTGPVSKNKSFFAPPLLPKENQRAEPAFFAGVPCKYTLPEKLPPDLVFVHNKNAKPNSVQPARKASETEPLEYETTASTVAAST